MEKALAFQLAELRRPRARELLPREKEYMAALEKMEAEGKLPKINYRPSKYPTLTLNHGIARSVKTSL